MLRFFELVHCPVSILYEQFNLESTTSLSYPTLPSADLTTKVIADIVDRIYPGWVPCLDINDITKQSWILSLSICLLYAPKQSAFFVRGIFERFEYPTQSGMG